MTARRTAATIEVGAHISTAGGIWTAIERAQQLEVESLQIFAAPPQTWRPTNHTVEACERFRALHTGAGLGQFWIHNIYLANLAHDDDQQWEKSIGSVVNALRVGQMIGAQGVVLHTGSHHGRGIESVLSRVAAAIERIFTEAPGNPVLALENAAGQGGAIGKAFSDLGSILRAVGSERLRVCLDTCHTFAAGYNLATPEGMRETLERFDAEIGLDRLAVLHANDSKQPLGSARDRHENIGDGHIGISGFEVILGTPEFRGKALLLEVPGIDGGGPDLENVRRLKAIREAASA